ncbi:recombinase family protein [Paenibacillus sp. F411]|uniref:recombinase family protein n=1 Tax=Paenibacillus sp. F411 TaxID=2820239 RepID=UPI001AAE5CA5|nr:recombinase family protein [Paenibacillus sp. F411]MBO2945620.1 recombinase family protein [Paenibacillus sp. F411]
MKIGYVRVSSQDQNEARQIEALQQQAVEKFFSEKVSGQNMNRPKLKEMMDFVREGDRVYIESISRLARNTLDFLNIVKDLSAKQVEVVSLKESIDTSTPQGKFMLTVFGALYELERDSIKQRQMEGIAVAKAKGTQFGRPKIEIDEQFIHEYSVWKKDLQTATFAMKKLGLSRSTFYRKVKEYEESLQ